jgi:N-acyl-D-aspartate/D-glutamate deacylase
LRGDACPRARAACPVPVCRCRIGERQASETADFFGFADRAHVAAGLRADVNLIDFDRLKLHQPEMVADLPAGGRRVVQRVQGYRATLMAGIPVFDKWRGHRRPPPAASVRAGH